MTDIRKTAFLILRVGDDFKKKLIKKALESGQTVSEFVRDVLSKKL